MSTINVINDFDQRCWHDCRIWGIEFRAGDPEQDDWTSDLRLDIDYICQWLCDSGPCRFLVAPAFLVFHDVVNLMIAIERRDPEGGLVPTHPLAATNNVRSATVQSEHGWKIKLNDPEVVGQFEI